MQQQTTYLMQFSGSPSQSVLHLNRSQDNHPIGGVRAKPFSKAVTFGTVTVSTTSNPNATRQKTVDRDITALLGIILILFCLSWSKGKVDLKVKKDIENIIIDLTFVRRYGTFYDFLST